MEGELLSDHMHIDYMISRYRHDYTIGTLDVLMWRPICVKICCILTHHFQNVSWL